MFYSTLELNCIAMNEAGPVQGYLTHEKKKSAPRTLPMFPLNNLMIIE